MRQYVSPYLSSVEGPLNTRVTRSSGISRSEIKHKMLRNWCQKKPDSSQKHND